jgi:hypothetical protein
MATGWIRAFRAVPWGEAIAAAPLVVASAKKVLAALRTREHADRMAPRSGPAEPLGAAPNLNTLHHRLIDLESDLVRASEVLNRLADQNAQLAVLVERLRLRTQALMWTCAVLAACTFGLLVWALFRQV